MPKIKPILSRLASHERRLTVLILAILWIFLSLSSYFLLAVPRGNLFDFYPRWVGARAVLNGQNPYTDEVSSQIQVGLYGERVPADQDQSRFAYPAIITWLLLPFWLLPFPVSVSLWSGLQLLIGLLLPWKVASLLEWRVSPPVLGLVTSFSILIYRHPINAFVLGQFVMASIAFLILAWWGLAEDLPWLTVLGLVGALIRPDVVLIPLAYMLVVSWTLGRKRIVVAWATLSGLLILFTSMRIGPWVSDFIRGVGAYAAYSPTVWPPGLLGSPTAAGLMVGVTACWCVWIWRASKHLELRQRIAWGLSAAAILTLLTLPQTKSYTLVLGLIPAWTLLRWTDNPWGWVSTFAILSSPWIFLATGGRVATLEQLLIPGSFGLALFLCLRQLSSQSEVGRSAVEIRPAHVGGG